MASYAEEVDIVAKRGSVAASALFLPLACPACHADLQVSLSAGVSPVQCSVCQVVFAALVQRAESGEASGPGRSTCPAAIAPSNPSLSNTDLPPDWRAEEFLAGNIVMTWFRGPGDELAQSRRGAWSIHSERSRNTQLSTRAL